MSFLILESTYDWDGQTDISFHSSYWKPRMTETDRYFMSFLILESTYDWDGQRFHFIPHIWNHVWQTDILFMSFLILQSTYDRRTYISFHSSYWNPRMTDGQTTFHFIPHIGNHVWQTDRQHFISFLILETTYEWDGQTIHFIPHIGNHVWQTDRQHFIPHIGNHVWQTDRHFISFLILETTYDRRTDNISFHSSYSKPRMTETDRHFISFLILETTYDRRTKFHFIPHNGNHVWLRQTDILFHSS